MLGEAQKLVFILCIKNLLILFSISNQKGSQSVSQRIQ